MDRSGAVAVVAVVAVAVAGVPVADGAGFAERAPTAGVVPGGPAGAVEQIGPARTAPPRTDDAGDAPPDPDHDVLGWEAGVWYDEAIDVDQSDGLDDAELDALVARSMARVEHLRRLEFREQVPVQVVPRSALSGSVAGPGGDARTRAWRDQVWEALFVVGEDADATAAFRNLSSAAVLGFYSPQRDTIVVVSESGGPPVVDNATLVHELVHALQDQHFDLADDDRFDPRTHDADLAANGLVEGDAGYVEALYAKRCRDGTWRCVPAPAGEAPTRSVNRGLHAALFQPYSDGPPFVARLVARGGWAAVNDLYGDPPETTARVIHPGSAPAEAPDRRFENRARNGWKLFIGVGADGTETVGEATIYAALWYQGHRFGVDAIRWRGFERPDRGALDTYDYTSTASAGWAGDVLAPYYRADERGYLWRTTWATERDARQFHRAYLDVLRGHGAERRGPGTWVVPDGPFADAFRVRRSGRTVTVVNGPDVAALDDIRPGLDGTGSASNGSASGGNASTSGRNASTSGGNAFTSGRNASTTGRNGSATG